VRLLHRRRRSGAPKPVARRRPRLPAAQRRLGVRVDAPDIGGKRHDGDWLDPTFDAVSHGLFEHDLGRIRHVEQGPDGELYAVTSNRDGRSDRPTEDAFPRQSDDRLVRIVQSE